MKRNAEIKEALSFDDVLLVPIESSVKPQDVSLKTRLTKSLQLSIPLIGAGHDNVTESAMAIALAQLGGIGVIHDNMPLGKQVEEVRRVKRAEAEIISNPITIAPDSSIAEALDLMTTYKISGLPVVEQPSQKVVGIITSRDIRFFEDYAKPVSSLMSTNVIGVKGKVDKAVAKKMLHENRIEKLIILDEQGRCVGLMTVKDIEKLARFPNAARDGQGRLLVAAAVSTGKDAHDRTMAMADAGLDVVFVDVGHAHTKEATATVNFIRQQRSTNIQVIAGNIATADAARSLIDAGADAIMVGVGALATSASRRVAGVGMPQLSAVLKVAEQCSLANIPVIVGSGVHTSAELAKSIAAGAEAVMIDQLFAGTDEAPGEIVYQGDHAYKVVNLSAKAQHRPQATTMVRDPYRFDEDSIDTSVPYRGAVSYAVQHLLFGLKSAMAYTGSRDIQSMINNAEFVREK